MLVKGGAMFKKNRLSILQVNILFLLLAGLLIIVGSIVQAREIYSGLLITEFILILIPNLIFLKSRGHNIKDSLRLNKITFKEVIMIILISIFIYPVVVFAQTIFLNLINIFKEIGPNELPEQIDQGKILLNFFVIALSPGICEEIMFRGTMLRAYESVGPIKGIVITGLLFGMFHFTILNFIGPAILGIVYGIIVYKTNSIYSSIIGHTANNTIALTISYYLNKYAHKIEGIIANSTETVEVMEVGRAMLFLPLFLIICISIVVSLIKRLPSRNIKSNYLELGIFNGIAEREGFVAYLPVLVVIIVFIFFNWKLVLV